MKSNEIFVPNCNKIFTAKEDIPTAALDVKGQTLKAGSRFTILGFAEMSPVSENGQPWVAVVVKTEDGRQLTLSPKMFKGQISICNKLTLETERQFIPTDFNKRTDIKDLWDYFVSLGDSQIEITQPFEYIAPVYEDGKVVRSVKGRLNQYKVISSNESDAVIVPNESDAVIVPNESDAVIVSE